MEVFNYIAISISVAGSFIIMWGVCVTTVRFLTNEKNKLLTKKPTDSNESIGHKFSAYLLLGLDFMLAADIIHSIHNPVLKELYVLAMIVGIRSVISFFLIKEIGSGEPGSASSPGNTSSSA